MNVSPRPTNLPERKNPDPMVVDAPTWVPLSELRARAARDTPRPRVSMETVFPVAVLSSTPTGLFVLWLESTPGAAGETNWWPVGMIVLLVLWLLARTVRSR